MIWPPLKAWTSLKPINGHSHFVAINYGGDRSNRWVILLSVIDGNCLIKVSWLELKNKSLWTHGWNENKILVSSDLLNNKIENNIDCCNSPSSDSGLTIPLFDGEIRPWFKD
mgnify:CR=1 FL=1|tara:strand:+ start:1417 stop:1752 length:336 start_codon:yes stop_codon:yes gene_type:complete